jgi:hypothetical protein
LDLLSLTADSTIPIWKDREPIALYGLEKTGHLCLVERTGGRAVGEGDVMIEKKADLRRPLPCAIVECRGGRYRISAKRKHKKGACGVRACQTAERNV